MEPTTDVPDTTPPERPPSDDRPAAGPYLRWALAALSVAAAAIHFGFAPAHLDEDWAHGGFFLVLGWFQLAWAALIVARPRRSVLALGVAVNLAVIVVWAVSRTSGLPFGPTADIKEDIGTPDVLATLFEGLIVVTSAALLARPQLADRPMRAPRVAFGAAAVIALLAATGASAAITPRYAGSHGHGTEAHDEMAGHDMAGDDTAGGHTEAHATTAAVAFDGDSPCELANPRRSAKEAKEAEKKENDDEGHDHRGPTRQKAIDQATFEKLSAEQDLAREVVKKYPTVADATAAGYKLSTVYIPCIGAHYTNTSLVAEFNPSTPSELLYDGTDPASKIVGLSYLLYHPGGAPEGFSGPNDVWHGHSFNGGLCMKEGVVIGGERTSPEECEKRGGKKAALKDIWMVHDWVVPGWECSWGVFAAECPELGGAVGAGPWAEPAKR